MSYRKAASYLPVIDFLKAYFKVYDRETHREIREKVTGNLLTLDRTFEPTLPALLALLDVPVEDAQWQALDPPQQRQRTLDAVKHLLLRESQGRPVLAVFEACTGSMPRRRRCSTAWSRVCPREARLAREELLVEIESVAEAREAGR